MKSLIKTLPLWLMIGLVGCDQLGQTQTSENDVPSDAEVASTSTSANSTEYVSPLPDNAPVIKVGTEANYAPYEFKDEYGNVIGFDIDLIRALGEKQGFKVEIYNDPWEEVFTNLESGDRDMIAAGLTYSDERGSKYGVSKSYAPTPSSLVYLDDNIKVEGLEDMSTLTVGVLSNSNPFRYFTENPQYIAQMEVYPTVFKAVQDMVLGNIDAVAADDGVLRYTVSNYSDLSPKFYAYEDANSHGGMTVYVVQKDNEALLAQLNEGIDLLKADGTYGKITQKWFGKDLTQASDEQLKAIEEQQLVGTESVVVTVE